MQLPYVPTDGPRFVRFGLAEVLAELCVRCSHRTFGGVAADEPPLDSRAAGLIGRRPCLVGSVFTVLSNLAEACLLAPSCS